MKIKSVTNVITNSSSEVFTICHRNDIDHVKNLINIILRIGGSTKTCDDLFDIEFTWNYRDLAMAYRETHEEDGVPSDFTIASREQLIEFAWNKIRENINDGEPDYFYEILPEIKVTAKSGEKLSWEFNHFTDMFAAHEEYFT